MKRWRIRLAAALALAGMGTVAPVQWASAAQSSQQDVRQAFEEGLRQSDGGPIFGLIERYYPQEARALMDRLYRAATPVIEREGDPAATDQAMQQAMGEMDRFVRSKIADVVNAPEPQLIRLLESQIMLMERLSSEAPALCGAVVTAGQFDFRALTPSLRPVFAQASLALIEAAGEGSRRQHDPSRLQLSSDDSAAWLIEVERRDPDGTLLDLIGDEAAMRRAAPAEQCAAALLIFRAVGALPVPQQARLVASMMRLGAEEPVPGAAGEGSEGPSPNAGS